MKVTKQHLANDATLFVLQAGSEYIEINVKDGSARLIENIKTDPNGPEDWSEWNAALDGFYALLLALATAGYDLTEMGDAITVAMDSIMNEHGES